MGHFFGTVTALQVARMFQTCSDIIREMRSLIDWLILLSGLETAKLTCARVFQEKPKELMDTATPKNEEKQKPTKRPVRKIHESMCDLFVLGTENMTCSPCEKRP